MNKISAKLRLAKNDSQSQIASQRSFISNVFFIAVFVLVLKSCTFNTDNEFLIREGHGVGNYKLGQKISNTTSINPNGLDLKINTDSIIRSITIKSEKYHTKENLRLGTDYKTIIKSKGLYYTDGPVLIKGNKKREKIKQSATKLPKNMWYDGIAFS